MINAAEEWNSHRVIILTATYAALQVAAACRPHCQGEDTIGLCDAPEVKLSV